VNVLADSQGNPRLNGSVRSAVVDRLNAVTNPKESVKVAEDSLGNPRPNELVMVAVDSLGMPATN